MNSKDLAWLIRRHGIEMTHLSRGSHIGAILSVADIIAVLYADVAHVDAKNPKWPERDRIILGKGHAGAAIYAALAECGFFPVEELKTHYANGSRLSGHVSSAVPGVELSTGSLGHGLSVGVGMAMAAKMDHKKHKVYVICGDGECDEGAIWEAALVANQYKLSGLIGIIDHNRMQSLDFCENTLSLESLEAKWSSFGWNVLSIDGHDHDQLHMAFSEIERFDTGKPSMIIANTVKGKGISFMENDILWHYRFPHEGWEYDQAVNELHLIKPEGVIDPYTPNGIANPQQPDETAEFGNNHVTSNGWHPTWVNNVEELEK
ncbi:MAG: transketolase [Spirochaetia bacterium]|jgi:transketolase|nr:transketolase [Spirochaetia bacterium]